MSDTHLDFGIENDSNDNLVVPLFQAFEGIDLYHLSCFKYPTLQRP